MAIPKKNPTPDAEEVCFFCYNLFDHAICNRFAFEMPIDKSDYVRDPHTNQLIPDGYARRSVEFVNGTYRTNDAEIIKALDNYTEDQRKKGTAPAVLISRKVMYPKGTVVQEVGKETIIEKAYVPRSLVERLDLQSIIELADAEFSHMITSPTKEEAVQELLDAGLIK